VSGEIHPSLKQAGFRKQRHTFNRETEPGLIQVVNVQMGPYDVQVAATAPLAWLKLDENEPPAAVLKPDARLALLAQT
jgi:Domain of unknown function (DUF4304)